MAFEPADYKDPDCVGPSGSDLSWDVDCVNHAVCLHCSGSGDTFPNKDQPQTDSVSQPSLLATFYLPVSSGLSSKITKVTLMIFHLHRKVMGGGVTFDPMVMANTLL